MADRRFNEVDLRSMLDSTSALRRSGFDGRWIVATVLEGRPWEVVVEPDFETETLVVITAYPVDH